MLLLTAIPLAIAAAQLATPTFDPPAPKTFASSIKVSIACASTGASIRYTTDGTSPTTASALYAQPLTFSASTTLKARAFKTGWSASSEVTGQYQRADKVENWVRLTNGVPRKIDVASTVVGGFITVPPGQGLLTITVENASFIDLRGARAGGNFEILARQGSTPRGTYPVWILVPDPGVLSAGPTLPLRIKDPAGADYFVGAFSWTKDRLISSYTITATFEPKPPAITAQPQSRTVKLGESAIFSVTASGQSLSYLWSKDGRELPIARGSSLSIAKARPTDEGDYQVKVTNPAGSVTSAKARLTVISPPTISVHPVSQTVPVGGTVKFTVVASGTAPLRYQWQRNGDGLKGETGPSLSLDRVRTSQTGDYRVIVSNAAGSVVSRVATLTVQIPATAPSIVSNPAGREVLVGTRVEFNVVAAGTSPLSYQWYRDGGVIQGAQTPTFVVQSAQLTDAGTYLVVVSNGAGAVTSNPAPLTVKVSSGGEAGPASFQGLGDLPGGDFYSEAFAVSGDGSVVVGVSKSASGNEAFRWSGGVMTGLGDLPLGRFESSAFGISADGATAVGWSSSTPKPQGNNYDYQAFAWQAGRMTGLGFLAGWEYGQAAAASYDGKVIVGQVFHNQGGQAARWDNGVARGLGFLPGYSSSLASAVSQDGRVIVGRSSVSATCQACRWENGVITGLGDLAGGALSSWATGVSADGRVVVGGGTSAHGLEAFRWEAGTMTGLGNLPEGGIESFANAVSGDGKVVVGYCNTAQGSKAFIWDSDHGMRSLAAVLSEAGVPGLAGWVLSEAGDISADGSTIVGRGVNPQGKTEGWIVRLASRDDSNDADLGVTMTRESNPDADGNLVFTVAITNYGPASATAVELSDALPHDVDFVSAATTQGACSGASGIVTCDLGTLPPQALATITIVIAPKTDGMLTNSATVSALQADPDPSNNFASITTPGSSDAASFQGLGDLPGGDFYSEAFAVSGDGSVVVGVSKSASGNEAFRWSGGVMTGLGDLPLGRFESSAFGLSGDGGTAVGWSSSTPKPQGNNYDYQAFAWQAGKMTGLGFLGGWEYGQAAAASYDGKVIVGQVFHDQGGQAARWNNGVARGLGFLPGYPSSLASAVSQDGTVIVGRSSTAATCQACRWDNGVISGLGDLPGGALSSWATGVSSDGRTVVGVGTSAHGREAVRWEGDAMSGLGTLPGSALESFADAVSGDGRIVVGYCTSAQGSEAFIWDSEHGMRSLGVVLNQAGVSGLGGWALSEAGGISADGSTIVGRGINPQGKTEGWIARLGRTTIVTP